MYPVTNTIENWLRKRDREFVVKATVNDIEYFDDVLIDFTIENSLSLSDELELGTVIPNKLVIRFRTQQAFPPNAKIVPYLALSSEGLTWQDADMAWEDADFPWQGGHTDWMPLGEFYIDNRIVDRGVWTYTCYDKLVFADTPYVSQLSYPTTMQAVWDEICTRLGFVYDSSVQIDPSYTIGAGPAGYSCRQVMSFIASANSACVYVDKTGTIKFRKISAADTPVFEMTEADYVRAKQTNPLKTYSRVVVIYDTDDGLYYEAGSGDDSQTLFIDNPFGTQAMANNILAQINGFSYTPISMPARGFPQLDQGDMISFETVESMAWEDADIAWQDANFRWDGSESYRTIILHQVLDFKGGLSMQIEAPSISEQQSEFVVEGTLEQAVNRLNRSTVRYDKPYYGITHSRELGMVVQREDGKSKLTLNSDVMDWQVDGVSSLYYDALDNRIKFSGTLEGADGIFSGTIQAGTIIGGTIEGSEITGGSIVGTTITGALIQTQGSYPRVELSSSNNLLNAWQTANNRLSIYPIGQYSAPSLFFGTSLSQTFMTHTEMVFHIISSGLVTHIQSENIDLNADRVDFKGWSAIRNKLTSKTLQQELNDIWTAIYALMQN